LRLYEQIRTGNRGVGAARLVGMNCQACHLALPATEVDRIRHLPADALVRCEHCGAILVR
jgi:predicted  nucleic acid-binding Zn-ribbon protein